MAVDTFELEKLERMLHMMQMKCMFRSLKGIDLHPGQIRFLLILLEKGSCTQTDIAEQMHVSCASVGMTVQRLVKIGLVEKTVNANDMRATNITLTAYGNEIAKRVEHDGSLLLAQKYKGLSQGQMGDYFRTLQTVFENIKNYYKSLEGEDIERTC